MSCYEFASLILNFVNIVVLGLLTFRIARSNEGLTQLQLDQNAKNQPDPCFWMVGQHEGLVEFVLINSGEKDMLIRSIRINSNNREPEIFFINCNLLKTSLDSNKIENIVIEKGKIYQFFFKYASQSGSYQFKLELMSFKGNQEEVLIDQSTLGPYYLKNRDAFYY